MPTKILIVEDQKDIIRLIRLTLEFENVELQEAANGVEAINILKFWTPDVVLSDVMMPEMDGWSLATHIRATPQLSHTKIVFLTARANANDYEQGKRVGADKYLAKPFSPLQLIDVLDDLTRPMQSQGFAYPKHLHENHGQ